MWNKEKKEHLNQYATFAFTNFQMKVKFKGDIRVNALFFAISLSFCLLHGDQGRRNHHILITSEPYDHQEIVRKCCHFSN